MQASGPDGIAKSILSSNGNITVHHTGVVQDSLFLSIVVHTLIANGSGDWVILNWVTIGRHMVDDNDYYKPGGTQPSNYIFSDTDYTLNLYNYGGVITTALRIYTHDYLMWYESGCSDRYRESGNIHIISPHSNGRLIRANNYKVMYYKNVNGSITHPQYFPISQTSTGNVINQSSFNQYTTTATQGNIISSVNAYGLAEQIYHNTCYNTVIDSADYSVLGFSTTVNYRNGSNYENPTATHIGWNKINWDATSDINGAGC